MRANEFINEGSYQGGLRKWFKEKWVNLAKKKKGGGYEQCGSSGDTKGYAKCVPAAKAARMSDKEEKSAINRKRSAQRKAGRPGKRSGGKGKTPIFVKTKVKEGTDQEFYTGGALGLPYPGTYEQENEPFKTKGQRRMGTLTTEERYKGNLGLMELIAFFKQHPELLKQFNEIKKEYGAEKSLEFALQHINKTLEPVLQEGVNDPSIFKVVFVVGGPGSGKSHISREFGLNSLGLVTVNSDHAFEYLMQKQGLDLKMPPEEEIERDIVRNRAKEIVNKKSDLAIDGRLGLHIDGTGSDFTKVQNLKNNFDMLGYDSYLIIVNTKLDVARSRNQSRKRSVPDDLLTKRWRDVQNNIGRFAEIFPRFSIIDNSGDINNTDSQINKVYTKLVKFLNEPPTKPIARKWIEDHKSQVNEKWSEKYKRSIDCSNPKGFSQRAHCQGRKK